MYPLWRYILVWPLSPLHFQRLSCYIYNNINCLLKSGAIVVTAAAVLCNCDFDGGSNQKRVGLLVLLVGVYVSVSLCWLVNHHRTFNPEIVICLFPKLILLDSILILSSRFPVVVQSISTVFTLLSCSMCIVTPPACVLRIPICFAFMFSINTLLFLRRTDSTLTLHRLFVVFPLTTECYLLVNNSCTL